MTGVTSAATGAIAGAAIVLGRRALFDIPTLVIFFLLQKQFVSGLTLGANKG